MRNVGTEVYTFYNGAITMHTLPNAVINDDMQDKIYIIHTRSKTSFDITIHFGNTFGQTCYRDHGNNAELIREFMSQLGTDLWEIFKSSDIANIYELINGDILEFIHSGPSSEMRLKTHYFEADDGGVYDIKIAHDVVTFMVSVTNITPDK